MCCFSGRILSVSNTNIFARITKEGRQFVCYSMALSSDQEVAMVLPLPVAAGQGDDAVKFIDLSTCPELFRDLNKGFPVAAAFSSGARSPLLKAASPVLTVHKVGAFDASYVPSIVDFSRLDERFRLPAKSWDQLPAYKDYGFAVFKLRQGKQQVHPMAFSFATRTPDHLFFPTVHIHDGEVHQKAEFDHMLYFQGGGQMPSGWEESHQLAGQFMDCKPTQGIVLAEQHVFRKSLHGMLANADWTVKSRAVV